MGIPMFREPSPTEDTRNHAAKDSCAAARSAIRRQVSVRRPSRYGSVLRNATLRTISPRTLTEEIERERERERDSNNPQRHGRSPIIPRALALADEVERAREREANGIQRHVRSPLSNATAAEDPFNLTSGFLDPLRARNARRNEQRRLDNALQQGRSGQQRLRIPRNSIMSDFQRPASPGLDTNNRQDQDHPQFTPRFAPAVAYHGSASPHARRDALHLSPFPLPDGLGPDLSATLAFPSLRRVGQRSINDASRSNQESLIDGLGDRQRSLSPDDDHANDAWETLLTTITPDTNLPSADSSFNSTSAPGTNVPVNGAMRSTAAGMRPVSNSTYSGPGTMEIVLDPYSEYLNPCDFPPSATDSESDSESETSHSLIRRYRAVRQLESLRRAVDFQGAMIRSQGTARRAPEVQSTMSSQPPIPTVSFAFSDSSTDQDLHQVQAVLDRLTSRQDLPDDFWASVGLSRNFGQRENDEPNEEPNVADTIDGPISRS
ncbi:uncharacterized protein BO66DRAFT_417308 [Aspergillus aculeatinus CBS 121060]|uniref:Uncharacterized protein n=1 Tax=Aspergillus aculeatinus CBS 121060 TaxID=1448322 RepID=A0ACD1HLW9_9EURO|nr:hypothetical protein BO66DRAFT_417308 [Aspergillus aculeatinus CBS 121060]RAH74598.1 hypothetical protein BO66DRAFT_417308 [Aspergillus aculeatinus CBS 121060]